MLLMAVTFLGDFLWLAYWTPHWWGSEMRENQFYLHTFVIFVSFANFVLKLIVLGTLATVKEDELRNAAGAARNMINNRQ